MARRRVPVPDETWFFDTELLVLAQRARQRIPRSRSTIRTRGSTSCGPRSATLGASCG
ncbi:MAG: hypothetical protein LC720_01320 [Actinobacteria bacterium]|nr:hypothetical protein [Actinomycetota bacterium]